MQVGEADLSGSELGTSKNRKEDKGEAGKTHKERRLKKVQSQRGAPGVTIEDLQ